MGVNVDRTMNKIENTLSDVAACPVAGTLAGCGKVIIGIAQAITALVCGILLIIPVVAIGDWSLIHYSWTHIKHGVGNIVGGAFEAIPLVGTGMYFLRQFGKSRASDVQVHVSTHHENKWMPYTSLVELDWSIEGIDDDSVNKVKEIFAGKLAKNGGERYLSAKRKMELAKEAIREPRVMLTAL